MTLTIFSHILIQYWNVQDSYKIWFYEFWPPPIMGIEAQNCTNLCQVCGFDWVLWFPSPMKLPRHDIAEILLKVMLNTITLTPLWTMYILLRFLFCELNNPYNWRTFILPYPLIILILFYNAKTKGGLDGQVIKAQKPNTTHICFVWILSSQFVISLWFFLPQ